MCYRDEQSGELSGLSRLRAFTQDDAHVFCRLSQTKTEFLKIWDIIHEFYATFGFSLRVRLSLRDPANPDAYLGKAEQWDEAEALLREIAEEQNTETFDGVGEAAFYGPKLDFLAKDSIGRELQVATIQLDFNQPERFDLTCVAEDGSAERIVMIHAAIMGSIERFLSVYIEHVAGNFPLWLSPVQLSVLPISEKHLDYAHKIQQQLTEGGLRVELDERSESIGKKIREATGQKIPYMLVVGDKEMESGHVTIRAHDGTDLGSLPISDVITKFQTEVDTKK
jgi:threonyl-tRNA synthetase